MPLDVVPSEKAENLKHQLDMMMEKELLQQQVDKQREEVFSTKQKLEEQSKLLQTPGLEFANITVETKDNFTEGSQETINSMKFRMQELQEAIIKKEQKLDLCQLQIQNLREQAQTEARLHEKQILALEDALREKVATVLVSQVQLKAVQQQIGLCREQHQSQMKESENVSDLKDDTILVEQLQGGEQTQLCQIGSKESNQIIPQHNGRTNSEYQSKEVIILRKQLTELQQQLIDLQKELELEKQVLSTTQQEAEEKEKKLTDLRDILEKKMSAEQDNRIQTPESLIVSKPLSIPTICCIFKATVRQNN